MNRRNYTVRSWQSDAEFWRTVALLVLALLVAAIVRVTVLADELDRVNARQIAAASAYVGGGQ